MAPQPHEPSRPTVPWSDEVVAALPLSQGRVELLEEIMSSPTSTRPVLADRDVPRRPGPRRWAVPLAAAAAAAAVAALASAPLWWPGDDAQGGPLVGAEAPAPRTQLVLDAPGWAVDNATGSPEEQEVSWFRDGDEEVSVDITRSPARPGATLATYAADYRDVTDPPSDGTPTRAAGLEGRSWSYDPEDRVVVLEPTGGFWFEVRASGMDDTAFEALLARLALVDQAAFEQVLPDDFVGAAQATPAVQHILDGITAETGVGLPAGVDQPTSDESDPYHFGADVAGAYACAWIEVYADARTADDRAAQREAQRVLATSRQWPVLVEMDEEGDYPEVVWAISDDIGRGRLPAEYAQGLGCDE